MKCCEVRALNKLKSHHAERINRQETRAKPPLAARGYTIDLHRIMIFCRRGSLRGLPAFGSSKSDKPPGPPEAILKLILKLKNSIIKKSPI